MAALVGAEQPARRVDEKHGCGNAVERVGEGGGRRAVQPDGLADQNRAADMSDEKLHAAARLVVDRVIPLVLECRRHRIDPALRVRPFVPEM